MDHYSILDQGFPRGAPETGSASAKAEPERTFLLPVDIATDPVRFPGDDGGRSLTAMAERDLNSALQLLAERAQYITGASGAAIALRQGAEMICRASAGPSAPELGAALQVNSGLSGESVRTRHLLRCDDAENDSRVNRENCRALGIASVVVMPLVRDGEVNGVFELLSDRTYAFEERDITALERLGEMIQTAVDHAEAAKRAQNELGGNHLVPGPPIEKQTPAYPAAQTLPSAETKLEFERLDSRVAESKPAEPRVSESRVDDEPILLEISSREAKPEKRSEAAKKDVPATAPSPAPQLTPETRQENKLIEVIPLNERGNIRRCEACGFPVSQGRKLCLDCEAKGISAGTPEFLSQFSTPTQGWLRSHMYLVGALLVAAATVALLIWFR